ncbi:GAF domain-containing protein [Streptomyces tauricus]|uniref:GAF domain-containing protein n=1 Tax=Streptomyces tauricus TaxID=68274 RepID=UPI002242FD90|nr:GAF domain-containing protein [Streptomyces tauricus]MCW8101427.1 GAF domain-containing protein [Streptomyces tauricus]
MSYDPSRPAGRLLLTPEDKEAPARTCRLRVLGLGERAEPALDAFARRLAELAGAPYAMVNFVGEERQFFAGLHARPPHVQPSHVQPPHVRPSHVQAPHAQPPHSGLTDTRHSAGVTSAGISTGTVTGSGSDHGSDMARGDTGLRGSVPPSIGPGRHMAREYGFCPHVVVRRKALVLEDVRDYPRFAGNPVVDEYGIRSYLGAPLLDRTGIALGTVCVTDVEPRPWGRSGLDTIKAMAAELVEQIELRAGVL